MSTRPTNENSAVVRLMIIQDTLSNNIECIDRRIEEYKADLLDLMKQREAKLEEQLDVCEAIDKLIDGKTTHLEGGFTVTGSVNVRAPAEPAPTTTLEFPDYPVVPKMQYTILPFSVEEEGEGPTLEEIVQFLIASGFPKGGH